MTEQNDENQVVLTLSHAEALVLFEWLARHDERLAFDDPAEEQVIWHIEAVLERSLPDLFSPDYQTALAEARETVRKSPNAK